MREKDTPAQCVRLEIKSLNWSPASAQTAIGSGKPASCGGEQIIAG